VFILSTIFAGFVFYSTEEYVIHSNAMDIVNLAFLSLLSLFLFCLCCHTYIHVNRMLQYFSCRSVVMAEVTIGEKYEQTEGCRKMDQI